MGGVELRLWWGKAVRMSGIGVLGGVFFLGGNSGGADCMGVVDILSG